MSHIYMIINGYGNEGNYLDFIPYSPDRVGVSCCNGKYHSNFR